MQQEKPRHRRLRRSDDEKLRLLDAWKKSGLSARAFEIREGLKKSCLWRWKQTVGERSSSSEYALAGAHPREPSAPRSGSPGNAHELMRLAQASGGMAASGCASFHDFGMSAGMSWSSTPRAVDSAEKARADGGNRG